MRICLHAGVFFPKIGGAQLMIDGLARGLMHRGHDVTVLTHRTDRGTVERPYPIQWYRRPHGHDARLRASEPVPRPEALAPTRHRPERPRSRIVA